MNLADGRRVHLCNADITDAGCPAQSYSEMSTREVFVVRLMECYCASNCLRLAHLVAYCDRGEEVLWEPCVGDYGDFLG